MTRIAGAVLVACALAGAQAALGAQSRGVQQMGNVTAVAPRPLASHPQGQQMMAQATKNAALLDVKFQFLNKSYENDTYATDPLGNKYKTSCWRFKSTSGFQFKMDQPQFTLTNEGLTIVQNIAKLTADGLTVRIMAGPCVDVAAGIGVRLSDIKLTYKARPMFTMEQNHCKISWSQQTDDLKVTIGDLNITGVQNNIDKLAKDAAREALNAVLSAYFGERLRSELIKVSVGICGGRK